VILKTVNPGIHLKPQTQHPCPLVPSLCEFSFHIGIYFSSFIFWTSCFFFSLIPLLYYYISSLTFVYPLYHILSDYWYLPFTSLLFFTIIFISFNLFISLFPSLNSFIEASCGFCLFLLILCLYTFKSWIGFFFSFVYWFLSFV